MKAKQFITIFFLIMFPTFLYAGTAYYVDGNAAYNGDGSFNKPWNNIDSVNAHVFTSGDDVYFKVNSSVEPNKAQGLIIDWDGTATDRVIIGAYYGQGLFGLNGNSRPIFDGQNNTYPYASESAMILINSKDLNGYITIKDLKISSPKNHGVYISSVNNVEVINCYTYQTPMRGIILARSSNSVVSDNIIEEASYKTAPGAGIVITGMDTEGTSNNNVISGNQVFHSFEGIGLYKKVTNSFVVNNILYDNRSFNIYMDSSKNNRIDSNLAYSSIDVSKWGGASYGIAIDNEAERGYCFTGGNEVSNNVLISVSCGIIIGCEYSKINSSCLQSGNYIHDNVIIDPVEASFKIWDSTTFWSGNNIEKNISWTISAGGSHAIPASPTGISWDNNMFDDIISGTSANNSKLLPYPSDIPVSAWRLIIPGSVNGNSISNLSFKSLINGSTHAFSNLSIQPEMNSIVPNKPNNLRISN